MQVKLYKRTVRGYKDVFTRDKFTKEVVIDLGKSGILTISEHQLGHPLRQRHVNISLEEGSYSMSYSMSMESLIKKIIS